MALLQHGAEVTVISPACCPEMSELGRIGEITTLPRKYETGDLKNSVLAIAATDDSDTNHKIADEASEQGILLNVVDDPAQSNFIVPACLYRGDLTIAVSTTGGSPVLARKIKNRLEQAYGEEYATLVDLLREVRAELKKKRITVTGDDWQIVLDLDSLIEMLRTGQREKARAVLQQHLESRGKLNG